MSYIDISSLSKAEVLCRLYNGGFNDVNHGPMAGVLQRMLPRMTLERAQALIDDQLAYQRGREKPRIYFDYVDCKALKVDLSGDRLDPWGYDRDCGPGAASRALGLPMVEGDARA